MKIEVKTYYRRQSRAGKHVTIAKRGKTCNECQARENIKQYKARKTDNQRQARENMKQYQAWENM